MLSSIRAFGPRLEPLSHAYSSTQRGDRYASRLFNRHDGEESPISQISEFDCIVDFSLLFNNECIEFPLLQEQADALAFETFEDQQCEIPKDWNTPGEAINVMEFLGVTRVNALW